MALTFIQETWFFIWDGIRNEWDGTAGEIGRIFTGAFKWLMQGGSLTEALEFIDYYWNFVWGQVLQIFELLTEEIGATFRNAFSWLMRGGDLFEALNGIKDKWDTIWKGLANNFSRIVAPIFETIRRIREAISSIGSSIGSIRAPRNLVSFIPGLQSGGTVQRGGVVDIHKNERVFLPKGAQVQAAGAGSPLGAGGGGSGVTINVYGDVNDAEAFYRKVNEARTQFERRGN